MSESSGRAAYATDDSRRIVYAGDKRAEYVVVSILRVHRDVESDSSSRDGVCTSALCHHRCCSSRSSGLCACKSPCRRALRFVPHS